MSTHLHHQSIIYLNIAQKKVWTPLGGAGDKSHTAAEEIMAVTPDCWSLREERRGPSQEVMLDAGVEVVFSNNGETEHHYTLSLLCRRWLKRTISKPTQASHSCTGAM